VQCCSYSGNSCYTTLLLAAACSDPNLIPDTLLLLHSTRKRQCMWDHLNPLTLHDVARPADQIRKTRSAAM
jgi:hypothetical protein